MKSIEEKAKAYDEAIKRAQEAANKGMVSQNFVNDIFSEPKQNEDERIRKELIKYLKERSHSGFNKEVRICNDAIAWLEKQGKKKRLDYPYVTGWRENRPDNKPQIKHSVLMLTTHGVSEGEWLGEEWCQYRWSCKVKDTDVLYWLHLSDLESLEKEGEQKPTVIIPMFRVGDEIKTSNEESLTITKIDEKGYWSEDLFICGFDEECIWDLVEQKPIDKIEPKFHKGEWVVFNNKHKSIYQVEKIEDGYYILRHTHGGTFRVCVLHDESLRLWTSSDAKDGDVLSYITDEGDLWIMIYWSLYEPYEGHVHYHALLVNNNFSDKDTCCIDIDNLKPSTEEQRDLLFQGIKNAGYEWDAEKKELKKIEQKPTEWSEEDEEVTNLACSILYSNFNENENFDKNQMCIGENVDKLKSIKERVQPQPKQEWTKKDESMRIRTIGVLSSCLLSEVSKDVTEEINWLKSLKDRVQVQPQNVWISVDKEVYVKEPILAQKKDKSDLFDGFVVCCDHTLTPNVYERYMILGNI